MTDDKINKAIAEACGWTEIQDSGVWHHHKLWGYPPLKPGQGGNSFHYLPDYCNDLNAIHEAEKVLTQKQITDYVIEVMQFLHEPMLSTARQRAEAFLRTLGKWEEARND